MGAYWDSGSRARATKHLVHAWVLWRQAVKAARQLRHKMAIAERWHARVALQRNVLAAWRRRCLANQRELAQKRADAQVAAARAELGADKDAEIAAIRCAAGPPAACGGMPHLHQHAVSLGAACWAAGCTCSHAVMVRQLRACG